MDTQQNTRGRRRLLGLVIGLTLMGTFSAAMSLAVFTDQETVEATFSSGSIDLDGAKIEALTLSIAPLMPGDAFTDDVVVENVGTAQLRYSISTATPDPGLRDALNLTIKTIDLDTPACDNFNGATLFTGILGAGGAVVGSPVEGADAGDRTLNGGAYETLCFQIELPLATTNAYAAATAVTTFTFDAEQTANNP